MAYTYLEFEKPISDLENKIESLRDNKDNDESVHQEISSLSDKIENLTKEIYEGPFDLAKSSSSSPSSQTSFF